MRACSFDPSSSRNLGFAIADIKESKELCVELGAGTFVLNTSIGDPRWSVLWPVFQIIDQFLTENDPDVVVIEQTGSFSGGFITSQVSNCIGVILACCGKHNTPVEFVYPTHVKKIVTGKGKATKSEMKKSVIAVLKQLKTVNTKFDSEHAYDAVANILTYLHECEDINFKIEPLEGK